MCRNLHKVLTVVHVGRVDLHDRSRLRKIANRGSIRLNQLQVLAGTAQRTRIPITSPAGAKAFMYIFRFLEIGAGQEAIDAPGGSIIITGRSC